MTPEFLSSFLGSLGPSGACVATALAFLSFLRIQTERQDRLYTQLYEELRELAVHKGKVLEEVAHSINKNAERLDRLERIVESLAESTRLTHEVVAVKAGITPDPDRK